MKPTDAWVLVAFCPLLALCALTALTVSYVQVRLSTSHPKGYSEQL